MLRRRIIAAATTLVLALGVSVGGAGAAFATVPPPPVPTSEECVPQAAIPPTDDVVETQYQRYSWKGGPITEAPTEVPPSANWQANTANKENGNHVNDPVGVPFQRDNPGRGNADWFFWTATEVIVQAGTPGVDAVTCPDPEPEPQPQYEVGLYLYKKVDQTKPASWENSGPQIFIASTTGTDWFTSYPGTLPQTVCGDGWAVQQDKVKHFGGFTWPALLQFPDQRLPIAPYQWKHEDLVPGNSLGLTIPECDLETEPLASVAFTWTPPACEVVQTVSVDPSAVVNATAHEPVVGDGTITFTVIADEGAAFSDDESDAPLFTAEDITASESDAPTFTWSVSDDFTVLTVTVTLTTVNPGNCATATGDITFAGVSCEAGASPLVDPDSFVNVKDATGRVVENGAQGGAFEVVFTAKQGTTFAAGLAGVRDGKTSVVSQDRKALTITGTLPGANPAACVETGFQILTSDPTCTTGTTITDIIFDEEAVTVTQVPSQDGRSITVTFTARDGFVFPGGSKEETREVRILGPNVAVCERAEAQLSVPPPTCDAGQNWDDVSFKGTQNAEESVTQVPTAENNWTYIVTFTATGDAKFFENGEYSTTKQVSNVIVPDPDRGECTIITAEVGTTDPACNQPAVLDPAQFVSNPAGAATFDIGFTDILGTYSVTVTAKEGFAFEGGKKSITLTGKLAGPDQSQCDQPTIEGSIASTACETDVPYILFTIDLTDPDGIATADVNDAAIIFEVLGEDGQPVLDSAGNPKRVVLDNLQGTVDDNGVFSGTVLWPGAAVENGQAAGWPGWALVDGEWTNVGDLNFGWTRTLTSATLSVNPTLSVELTYPAATPECATEPTPVPASIEFDYTCETGGVIELSDTPGVIWSIDGVQTDQRVLTGYSLDDQPVITASLDPELPGVYFAPDAVTELTVEFEAPEFICPTDLPRRPLVVPTVTSTQPTCTTAGSYTLGSDLPGVQWLVNGQPTAPGTYTAPTGSTVEVQAVALQGFGFGFEAQTRWSLPFTAPAAAVCAPLPTLALGEPVAPATARDLQTLALTGASGMLGTVGLIALLITLAGIGAVVARRRVDA